jgi:putative hemolysin
VGETDLRFRELSYANDKDPRFKRWFIRSIEGLSGRDRFARLYDIWRTDIVGKSDRVFGKMLDIIDVGLEIEGAWPPEEQLQSPLVIVANHPFGIGDGIAVGTRRTARPTVPSADPQRSPEGSGDGTLCASRFL